MKSIEGYTTYPINLTEVTKSEVGKGIYLRLTELLEKIETIRSSLIKELNKGQEKTTEDKKYEKSYLEYEISMANYFRQSIHCLIHKIEYLLQKPDNKVLNEKSLEDLISLPLLRQAFSMTNLDGRKSK